MKNRKMPKLPRREEWAKFKISNHGQGAHKSKKREVNSWCDELQEWIDCDFEGSLLVMEIME
jgi:DNA topoisomerase IA